MPYKKSSSFNGKLNENTKLIFDYSAETQIWKPGWAYRKIATVSVVETYATVHITSDSDLSIHAKSDGSDICFLDAGGDVIRHYRSFYDNAAGEGIFILENCPNTTLYLFYGNPSAPDQSTAFTDMYLLWDFEGSYLTDKSGNSRDAVEDGSFSTTSSNYHTCLKGSDVNWSYYIKDKVALDTTKDLHFSFWHYKSTSLGDDSISMCGCFSNNLSYPHAIRFAYRKPELKYKLHIGNDSIATDSTYALDATRLISINYTVATNTWKVYINGQLAITYVAEYALDSVSSDYSVGLVDSRVHRYTKTIGDLWDNFYIDNTVVTQAIALQKYTFETSTIAWGSEVSFINIPASEDTYIQCDTQGPDELKFCVQGLESLRLTKDSNIHDNFVTTKGSEIVANNESIIVPTKKSGYLDMWTDNGHYARFYCQTSGAVTAMYNVNCSTYDTSGKLCLNAGTSSIINRTGSTQTICWKYEYSNLT